MRRWLKLLKHPWKSIPLAILLAPRRVLIREIRDLSKALQKAENDYHDLRIRAEETLVKSPRGIPWL